MAGVLMYATSGDVERWIGAPPPEKAEALIRRASVMVGVATRMARYATTPAGMPVDPDIVDALRDATTAQVAAWHTAGIDATSEEVTARVAKTSLDGASLDYDTRAADEKTLALRTTLCDEARDILDLAGLLGGHPWVK